MIPILKNLRSKWQHRSRRGQAYLELALVLPVIIIILLGLVEVVIFIGRYLDVLDLTREAARFASVRDPMARYGYSDANNDWTISCSNKEPFDFYFHTACIFSPPMGSCPNISAMVEGVAGVSIENPFCNGLNQYFSFNPETDDIVIAAYTVTNNVVTTHLPNPTNCTTTGGYWAFSEAVLGKPAGQGNWAYDKCEDPSSPGPAIRRHPFYNNDDNSDASINTNDTFVTHNMEPGAVPSKGYIGVEYYGCYSQVLNIPLFTAFVPNPIQIHAYTLMSNPAIQPSPTPIHGHASAPPCTP